MVKKYMNGEGNLLSRTNYNVPMNVSPALLEDMMKSACYGALSALMPNIALNLDNNTQQTEWMMPSGEESDDMLRRQKLTINNQTQWYTYNSAQELVNLVTAMTAAKFQPSKANITFGTYALDWYERYKKPQLGDGHNENYKSMLKVHILPAIGDKDIADITVRDVQDIMNTLKTASTGKQVKSIINMVMDAAIADELYHHPNPTKDKRIHMPTKKEPREPVPQEDLARIMNHLPNMLPEHTSLLAMLIMTGARRGEALGTRWEDIDWKEKTIHLQRVVRFKMNQPVVSDIMKTPAANRTIALWDELIPYLGAPQESGYIVHKDGQPLSERSLRNRWNAMMKELVKIGVTPFTAHQLRHSYATIAANSGDIASKVLQGMLGHTNFATTMNIYAGLDNEKIRQSSSGLSAAYAQICEKSCSKVE